MVECYSFPSTHLCVCVCVYVHNNHEVEKTHPGYFFSVNDLRPLWKREFPLVSQSASSLAPASRSNPLGSHVTFVSAMKVFMVSSRGFASSSRSVPTAFISVTPLLLMVDNLSVSKNKDRKPRQCSVSREWRGVENKKLREETDGKRASRSGEGSAAYCGHSLNRLNQTWPRL